jgi:hypothetical protein
MPRTCAWLRVRACQWYAGGWAGWWATDFGTARVFSGVRLQPSILPSPALFTIEVGDNDDGDPLTFNRRVRAERMQMTHGAVYDFPFPSLAVNRWLFVHDGNADTVSHVALLEVKVYSCP